jgi:V/A-type H+/Na+-transporting ATPase subunit A
MTQAPSSHPNTALGKVINAYGNLLQVEFDGHIRQGEVAMVQINGTQLKAEVIEIAGNIRRYQGC